MSKSKKKSNEALPATGELKEVPRSCPHCLVLEVLSLDRYEHEADSGNGVAMLLADRDACLDALAALAKVAGELIHATKPGSNHFYDFAKSVAEHHDNTRGKHIAADPKSGAFEKAEANLSTAEYFALDVAVPASMSKN
jgi:hypothetical protein